MKKLILLSVLLIGLSSSFGFEGGVLAKVSDNELDKVYAQGFTTNYQIIGNNINSMNTMTYNITEQFPQLKSVANSIFISGAAQSNTFAPVNAVNSAVNVPINIVVIMNSQIVGGVNINNALQAITHLPTP